MALPGARRRQWQHRGVARCQGWLVGKRDSDRHQPGASRAGACPESVGAADGRTHRRAAIGVVRLGQLPRVLHQIAEYAPQVLAQMAAAVRPGGWLVIQEPDFHLAPTTEPDIWARTWEGVIAWGLANGVDWLIGRRLPSMVTSLDIGQPQAKTDVQNFRGRDRGALYFQLFLAEVRDRVIDAGHLDAATLDAASALLDDPNYWTQCWMMTAVWVRKPPSDAT
jgi:hypothetical protein